MHEVRWPAKSTYRRRAKRAVALEGCALHVLEDAGIEEAHAELLGTELHVGGIAGSFGSKQAANRMLSAALPHLPIVNEMRIAERHRAWRSP